MKLFFAILLGFWAFQAVAADKGKSAAAGGESSISLKDQTNPPPQAEESSKPPGKSAWDKPAGPEGEDRQSGGVKPNQAEAPPAAGEAAPLAAEGPLSPGNHMLQEIEEMDKTIENLWDRPLIGKLSPEIAAWIEQLHNDSRKFSNDGGTFNRILIRYYERGRDHSLKDIRGVFSNFADMTESRRNNTLNIYEQPMYLKFLKEAAWEPLERAKSELADAATRLHELMKQADQAAKERLNQYQEIASEMDEIKEEDIMNNANSLESFIAAMDQAHGQEKLFFEAKNTLEALGKKLEIVDKNLSIINEQQGLVKKEIADFVNSCRQSFKPKLNDAKISRPA